MCCYWLPERLIDAAFTLACIDITLIHQTLVEGQKAVTLSFETPMHSQDCEGMNGNELEIYGAVSFIVLR
eukprot:g31980.t1